MIKDDLIKTPDISIQNTDDIYGITIDEYLKLHNVSLKDLIENIKIDIDLLQKNFYKEVFEKEAQNIPLINNIYEKLIKKKNRLKRLQSFLKDKE